LSDRAIGCFLMATGAVLLALDGPGFRRRDSSGDLLTALIACGKGIPGKTSYKK
jgi:hypothetical protein